jgi:hypothetical protein
VSPRHWLALLVALGSAGCAESGGVFTQHNDNARTGAALAETILANGNVNVRQFGRVARLPVRGSTFVQPLFVPGVKIAGKKQDLVVIATMHNAVYAFAADGRPAPLWGPVSLGPSIALPDPEIGPRGYKDIYGEVGVMSTPVVSPGDNALFLVAATKEGDRFVHRLHRLDLSTGTPQRPAVVIAAAGFESPRQGQRSALLLEQGRIYVAFASYGDRCPYRGWMFAYDADTLAQRAALSTSSGEGAGFWMGGQGPAADDGGVYALTGNHILDDPRCPVQHPVDLSDSIVRLDGRSLAVATSFTPANKVRLNVEDGDLGGAGALLVPGTNLLMGAGKEARVFLVERQAMGGFDAGRDDQQPGVAQRFFANRERCPKGQLGGPRCHHIHSTPVFWDGPLGPWIYVWPENDFLKAFRFDRQRQRVDCRGAADPDCDPISSSTTTDPENVPGGSRGMPGGFLSISADGGKAGTGLVWAFHPYQGNANQKLVDGILRVYDASDLRIERWNSRQDLDRDDLGPYPKFTWPTVARGRVYAPSFSALTGRVLLDALSESGPALAAGPGGKLYVAWTGIDGRLGLAASANGRTFPDKVTVGESETAAGGPALAGDEGALFLSFVDRQGRVHLGRSQGLSRDFAPLAVDATSAAAPALAVGGGRVVLAWRGSGDDRRIRLASAPVGASRLGEAVILDELTALPPALASVEGKLFLLWTGTDQHLNVAEVAGTQLTGKRTLEETAGSGPALAARRSTGGAAPDLHLFWGGTDEATHLNVISADDGDPAAFHVKVTLDDQTAARPAAVLFAGQVFVAWSGADAAHHLTVARFNPGELSVYGLLGQ